MAAEVGDRANRKPRRYRRVIKRLETECSADGREFRAISSEISGGGLFLRTSKFFSPDTTVDLKIHLPGDIISLLKAKVRFCGSAGKGKIGLGLEIIENDQNYIDFLNTLLPEEDKIRHKEKEYAEPGPLTSEEHGVPEKTAPPRPKTAEEIEDEAIDSLIRNIRRDQK